MDRHVDDMHTGGKPWRKSGMDDNSLAIRPFPS